MKTMHTLRLTLPVLLSSLLLTTARAFAQYAAHPRSLITAEQVLEAIGRRHLPVAGVQVHLPARITSASAAVALEVQSVTPTGPRAARLRVVCVNHTECLPFLTEAVWPADAEAPELTPPASGNAASAGVAAENAAGMPHPAPQPEQQEKPLLHAGSPATLEMEQGRIHIRIQVISLQPGRAGDHIRVSTRDRKQTYTAEVVSGDLLKAAL